MQMDYNVQITNYSFAQSILRRLFYAISTIRQLVG